jgi:hypothetical protein
MGLRFPSNHKEVDEHRHGRRGGAEAQSAKKKANMRIVDRIIASR